jgi:hypothetical protein
VELLKYQIGTTFILKSLEPFVRGLWFNPNYWRDRRLTIWFLRTDSAVSFGPKNKEFDIIGLAAGTWLRYRTIRVNAQVRSAGSTLALMFTS